MIVHGGCPFSGSEGNQAMGEQGNRREGGRWRVRPGWSCSAAQRSVLSVSSHPWLLAAQSRADRMSSAPETVNAPPSCKRHGIANEGGRAADQGDGAQGHCPILHQPLPPLLTSMFSFFTAPSSTSMAYLQPTPSGLARQPAAHSVSHGCRAGLLPACRSTCACPPVQRGPHLRERTPRPLSDRSSSAPMACAKTALPSASIITLPSAGREENKGGRGGGRLE